MTWDVYTTSDLAFILEICDRTAWAWFQRGVFPGAHKTGKCWRVTRRGLLQYIEETCQDDVKTHRMKRLAEIDERRIEAKANRKPRAKRTTT